MSYVSNWIARYFHLKKYFSLRKFRWRIERALWILYVISKFGQWYLHRFDLGFSKFLNFLAFFPSIIKIIRATQLWWDTMQKKMKNVWRNFGEIRPNRSQKKKIWNSGNTKLLILSNMENLVYIFPRQHLLFLTMKIPEQCEKLVQR